MHDQVIHGAVRWYFYKDPSDLWHWDAVGRDESILARSAQAFDSRAACVEDAKTQGYGTPDTDALRVA
jgi:hypothetical protein